MRCEIYDLSSGVGLRGTWNPETLSEHRKNDKHIFKVVFEGSNKREEAEDFFQSLLKEGRDSQFVSELSVFEGQLTEIHRSLRRYGSGFRDSYELTWEDRVAATRETPLGKAWQEVTARAGETLTDVAARVYGNPKHWRLLARANKVVQPLCLKAGQLLKVPPAP